MGNRIDAIVADLGLFPSGEFHELADKILEEVAEVIISCDENPKMVVHEPYRSILSRIQEHFNKEAT